MLIGFIEAIRSQEPDIKIDVITIFPTEDISEAERFDVTLIDGRITLRKIISRFIRALGRRLGGRLLNESSDSVIRSIENADLVVDLSGDGFTEDYGTVEVLASVADIILVKLLQKKFVVYAQSIGPFYKSYTRILATKSLNRVDLLMIRENITKEYLNKINVKKEMHLVGDAALLMEPAPNNRAMEILSKIGLISNVPRVGISISQHLYQNINGLGQNYLDIMVYLINHITEKFNAHVVLIPHVSNMKMAFDDFRVSEIVMNHVENSNMVFLLKGDYRADELKAVISTMDIFIGARMHANIAALSTNVPVLAISYSHKTEGIMDLLGLAEWVISANNLSRDVLIEKTDSLWSSREAVRKKLIEEEQDVKALAWHGVYLTFNLLNGVGNY